LIRQKLIDDQIAYLKNLKNKENEILEKQVKEAEEKKENERQEKLKRMNELKMQIELDRNSQMSRKLKLKEQALQDDKDFIENWKQKMLILEEAEREELREIRERNKNLQNYHKSQIDVKRQKNEDKFIKESEDAYKTLIMLNNEQDNFLNYAEHCVKEYQAQGKDITPLIIELGNYKKKLFKG